MQYSEVTKTWLQKKACIFKGYVAQQRAGQKHGRQIPMWSAREQCRYIQISIYKRVPKATGGKKEKNNSVFSLTINMPCILRNLLVILEWSTDLPEALRLWKRMSLYKQVTQDTLHCSMYKLRRCLETYIWFLKPTEMLWEREVLAALQHIYYSTKDWESARLPIR